MSWPKFIESGKVATTFLLTLAIVTGLIVFLPDSVKQTLKISEISIQYGSYVGIAFLISATLFLIQMLISIARYFSSKISRFKTKKYIRNHLNHLTEYEKSVIREFYVSGQDTLPLPYNNSVVEGLVSKRILIRISGNGYMQLGNITFNYIINEYAKKHISHDTIGLSPNP